jgi:hypothetical protein
MTATRTTTALLGLPRARPVAVKDGRKINWSIPVNGEAALGSMRERLYASIERKTRKGKKNLSSLIQPSIQNPKQMYTFHRSNLPHWTRSWAFWWLEIIVRDYRWWHPIVQQSQNLQTRPLLKSLSTSSSHVVATVKPSPRRLDDGKIYYFSDFYIKSSTYTILYVFPAVHYIVYYFPSRLLSWRQDYLLYNWLIIPLI